MVAHLPADSPYRLLTADARRASRPTVSREQARALIRSA